MGPLVYRLRAGEAEPASFNGHGANQAGGNPIAANGQPVHLEEDASIPPFDFKLLVNRCLGRIELAERLIASFDARFPLELSQIEQCFTEGDWPGLARRIHQLKGAAGNVSAAVLHSIATRMEAAARAERADDVTACLLEIHAAWQLFQEHRTASQSQNEKFAGKPAAPQ